MHSWVFRHRERLAALRAGAAVPGAVRRPAPGELELVPAPRRPRRRGYGRRPGRSGGGAG